MSKTWCLEPEIYQSLNEAIPALLASQRPDGQFGTQPWICRDQHLILPLAVAWQTQDSPYFGSEEILEAIVLGGDALINDQDEIGMWTFRKKDHSTWGQIYMPWTYSRWIRTYQIIRNAVSAEVRDRWDSALTLGFEGISKSELERIHNIPTHHAMALYCAGDLFERDDWKLQATEFLHTVVSEQSTHGWWTENVGPVVAYNYVYVDALGVYYQMSGDEVVLDPLERSARFHASYTYPDGSMVETVDERNPYHAGIHLGNPGFSHTPAGRGYLAQQHALHLATGEIFDVDYAANMILSAGSGSLEETAASRDHHVYQMDQDALVVRKKPWFLSLSAYVCAPADTRWRQDRQNFVSIFHDKTGLIVGGGNTKLQPLWSTCTVGDTSLLYHKTGEEEPDFSPRDGLRHVPDDAILGYEIETPSLKLAYGKEVFEITCVPNSDSDMSLVCEATTNTGDTVEGHMTLWPHLGERLNMSNGEDRILGEQPVAFTSLSETGWIEHHGWRLSLPPGTNIIWPVLPHNPYRKQGDATIEEARIVLALPFSQERKRFELFLTVLT